MARYSHSDSSSGGSDNTILIVGGLILGYYLYNNWATIATPSASSGNVVSNIASSILGIFGIPSPISSGSPSVSPVVAGAVSCAVNQALSNGICTQCPPGWTVQGPISNQQYCVAPSD